MSTEAADFEEKIHFIRTLLTLKFTCLGYELIHTLKAFLSHDKHQKLLQTITNHDVKKFVEEQSKVQPNSYSVTLELPRDESLDDKYFREALLSAAYYPKELETTSWQDKLKHNSQKTWYIHENLAYAARYGMYKAVRMLITSIIWNKELEKSHHNFYSFLINEGSETEFECVSVSLPFEGPQDLFVTEPSAYYKIIESREIELQRSWVHLDSLWAIIRVKHDNFTKIEDTTEEKKLMSTLQEPIPPFFSYKSDVYEEFRNMYPDKKRSELTALIADAWNNLDSETREKYEQRYENSLAKHKRSWTAANESNTDAAPKHQNNDHEETTFQSKKLKTDKKTTFITNIFTSIMLNTAVYDHSMGPIGSTIDSYKHDWEFHNSWSEALAYIKAQFRIHLDNYRSVFCDVDGSECIGKSDMPHHESVDRKFEATIIDCANAEKHSISEEMLSMELKNQLKQIHRVYKYCTINILRERDFNSQAIRDVILCLPRVELTPIEIHSWEKKLDSSYYHPYLH